MDFHFAKWPRSIQLNRLHQNAIIPYFSLKEPFIGTPRSRHEPQPMKKELSTFLDSACGTYL